jgi:Fur family transcriptional regulator, peroxide stress response regulator
MGRTTDATGKREVNKMMEAFREQCHEAGLRVTPQRTAVYQALVETDEHPSAETVFRQVRQVFPCISLDTVNRTLMTLSDMGAAFIVPGSGDAKRFDANLEDHQHFRCVKCKRIVDLYHEPHNEDVVSQTLPAGFTVLRSTIYVEGVCNLCHKAED